MLVLPISMARSMDCDSISNRNHVAGDNPVQHSMIVFKNQRAVPIDAARPAGENLIQMLNLYAPFAPTKMRFPTPPQSVEAEFFKLSIAPVEVLNQSQQNVSRSTLFRVNRRSKSRVRESPPASNRRDNSG